LKTRQFIRWLKAQGVRLAPGRGSHLKLYYRGRQSVLPVHSSELGSGLVHAIKRQLGLPDGD
jgi:mRNA interferase HicA